MKTFRGWFLILAGLGGIIFGVQNIVAHVATTKSLIAAFGLGICFLILGILVLMDDWRSSPDAPPLFTPARIKQGFLLVGVLAVFIGATSILQYFQNQHTYVNTQGMIVYASDSGSPGQSHIFLMNSDGTGVKQLTKGNENDTSPVFSPDGSSIAFISDKSGTNQVYVMDAKGSQINQISTGNDSKADPKFTPDGNSVGFLSRGQLISTDTISLAGQLLYPLNNPPGQGNSNSDSSNSEKLPVTDFGWSSMKTDNGYDLAVIQTQPDTDIEVCSIVPADTTKQPAILIAGNKLSITWSPDGSKLAVAVFGISVFDPNKKSFVTEPTSGIALFNRDGSPIQQPLLAETNTNNSGAQNVSFSADGNELGVDVLAKTNLGEIRDGGIAILATTPGTQPHIVAPPGSHSICFAPDKKHAAFLTPSPKNPNKMDIVVVDMTQGHGKDVSSGDGNVSSAQWSPAVPKN